jgi:ribosomal protein S18 acetylase RimI-like enzyme
MKVTLKKADQNYVDFAKKIFFQHKTNELNAHQWPDQVLLPILENQFNAQEIAYKIKFPNAERFFLMLKDLPVGILLLNKDKSYHIINIIIDSQFQGQKIGTSVLSDIIEHAKTENKQVTLKVDRRNPALRLYMRLGFEITTEDEIYVSMIA